ncbi:hypothetical protein ABZ934_25025 [Streptomyces sp. NPDC046557]|uniref:hypothetical protein n=1 Tax=Streptomyces sp. NPDC046557 TaxID=3155372 RepID=UPI0033D7CD1E
MRRRLVDPAAVMRLNGGTDRVEPKRRGARLALGRLPGSCSFESVREVAGATELFKAYATEVAARRGCSGVRLPE